MALLVAALPQIEASPALGLAVRARALLGEARLESGDGAQGAADLASAAERWSSAEALDWIRSLPSGESSQLAVQQAADAAAGAVLRLAELDLERHQSPAPVFRPVILPVRARPSRLLAPSAIGPAERAAIQSKQRAAVVRYVNEQLAPWVAVRRRVLGSLQRRFERVYLVPPVASPYYRIAVAASVGAMWGRFVAELRDATSLHDYDAPYNELGESYYMDPPWEGEKSLARSAFEECLALSRRYRLFSSYTLACETWLGDNFRGEYSRLDELMPSPDWLSSGSAVRPRPALLE